MLSHIILVLNLFYISFHNSIANYTTRCVNLLLVLKSFKHGKYEEGNNSFTMTELSYQLIRAKIIFYFQSSNLSLTFKCL